VRGNARNALSARKKTAAALRKKQQQEIEAASDSTNLEQEPVSLEKMPANA
jgi:hypothetical protein